MKQFAAALIAALFFLSFTPPNEASREGVLLSAEEWKLYDLLNEYRNTKGLPPIPLSSALTKVAQLHTADLRANHPEGSSCNLHSWSSKGGWKSCCYTPDHAQAQCMWSKPKELTTYKGYGFEIACYNSNGVTAATALEGWKSSPAHHAVIINQDIWKEKWNAIGISINGNYSVVWFGHEADEVGSPARR